jgi:hypothetical protein
VSAANALRPGRWLVEVGEDGYILWSRIGPDDKAHGGAGEDLRLPGVNAWLDWQRDRPDPTESEPETVHVDLVEYEWRRCTDGVVLKRQLMPSYMSHSPMGRVYHGAHDLYVRYQQPGADWLHIHHWGVEQETRP